MVSTNSHLNWKFYRVYDEDVSLKMKVLTNNAEKF